MLPGHPSIVPAYRPPWCYPARRSKASSCLRSASTRSASSRNSAGPAPRSCAVMSRRWNAASSCRSRACSFDRRASSATPPSYTRFPLWCCPDSAPAGAHHLPGHFRVPVLSCAAMKWDYKMLDRFAMRRTTARHSAAGGNVHAVPFLHHTRGPESRRRRCSATRSGCYSAAVAPPPYVPGSGRSALYRSPRLP